MLIIRRYLVIATLALGACSNARPHPFDRMEAAQSELAELVCSCLGGTATEIEQCRTRLSVASELMCFRAVYDRHSAELGATADCLSDATEQYAACLRVLESACMGEGYASCTDTVSMATRSCPSVPASLADEWFACDTD